MKMKKGTSSNDATLSLHNGAEMAHLQKSEIFDSPPPKKNLTKH